MREPSIRVLIADDHALFRDGVRRFLELEPGFLVVGDAADGEEAAQQCERVQPDVLLLDVNMPRLSGIEALNRVRLQSPRTAVVLLTAGIDRAELLEALLLGARGLVLKSAETEILVKAIRTVAAGGYWLEHAAIGDLVSTLRTPDTIPGPASEVTFTARERQIVSAVVDGASNADIGQSFGLSGQTVKNHLTRIYGKAGVSSRLELALYAITHRVAGRSVGTTRVAPDDEPDVRLRVEARYCR